MALPLAVTAGAAGAPNADIEGAPPNPPPPKPAGAVVAAGAPKPPAVALNPVEGAPNAEAPLGGVLNDDPNPPLDDPPVDVGVELGGLDHPALAAVSACFCASLSPGLANMIPLSVPVKNVAIGIINSKNFWSIGLIALRGCVTNIKEYRTTNTIPNNVNDRQMPIKNFSRAISCSSV